MSNESKTREELEQENARLKEQVAELKEEIQRLKWAATTHD